MYICTVHQLIIQYTATNVSKQKHLGKFCGCVLFSFTMHFCNLSFFKVFSTENRSRVISVDRHSWCPKSVVKILKWYDTKRSTKIETSRLLSFFKNCKSDIWKMGRNWLGVSFIMYGKAAYKLIVCFTVCESGHITFGCGVTEWSVRRVLFGSLEFVSRGWVFFKSHKKTTI
jgi:hypothetical protein